ncbi:hypothetical protein K493DRAFT_338540 [Basidiobolus meristosporus CBS 931.73]|uniref:STB6-like N-terminal domain-containing protein n=1 Tax=Basidiobolus meristosporus CBS 931.73 TaxID=1314790 RepID=A0A1Y1Y4Q5_9FUNG|nr:hypothetical protein K493DRAFT_338540 [Basidiobolus meristosporus CBS 931.73]|eukprot:ORX92939.1 hypothetical protein K493DRAFT_338540 [Basidiobolus meristosporus CBS 931.73]
MSHNFIFWERSTIAEFSRRYKFEITRELIELEGFQIYIVEQWITNPIFTGAPTHTITACVLTVPLELTDEQRKALSRLYDELGQNGAREINTKLGSIMATNLDQVPTSLNLVSVPDGKYDEHIIDFCVNINLKRLGCSGRSALTLKPPSQVQQDKFHQVYKTSDFHSFRSTVLEVVILAQKGLALLGLYHHSDVDGLLCDSTLNALQQYYLDFGPFDFEMGDVKLGPQLFASLLSKIITARNKLHSLGYQVGKDPFFDGEQFIAGLSAFQERKKLNQLKYLDNQTLKVIDDVYDSSSQQSLNFPKALITFFNGTFQVNKRISSAFVIVTKPTTDLEYLVKNANFDRFKYLWRGKSKSAASENGSDLLFSSDWISGGKSFFKGVTSRLTVKSSEPYKDNFSLRKPLKDLSLDLSDKGKDIEITKHLSPTRKPLATLSHESKDAQQLTRIDSNASFDKTLDQPGLTSIDSVANTEKESPENTRTLRLDSSKSTEEVKKPFWRSRSSSMTAFDRILDMRENVSRRRIVRTNSVIHLPSASSGLSRQAIYSDLQTFVMYNELIEKEATLKELSQKLEMIHQTYEEKLERLNRLYTERHGRIESAEDELKELLARQEKVSKSIEQVEVENAKLKYKATVLEDKLDEIEEFTGGFISKVHNFAAKIPISENTYEILYSWWVFCQRIVIRLGHKLSGLEMKEDREIRQPFD